MVKAVAGRGDVHGRMRFDTQLAHLAELKLGSWNSSSLFIGLHSTGISQALKRFLDDVLVRVDALAVQEVPGCSAEHPTLLADQYCDGTLDSSSGLGTSLGGGARLFIRRTKVN